MNISDAGRTGSRTEPSKLFLFFAILLFASAVYLGCIVSPPSLMDDVDAVQAQIARNMLSSGDWVTARLNGVAYLEKAPLVYWVIAISYQIFGPYDWAARIPIALSAIALCLLASGFGMWAFGKRAGFYVGLCMSTCVGLFLFTRILIPDVMLTAVVSLAMWAFLRALDEQEKHPRLWAFVLALSLGIGLLLKSLIGVLFPVAAGIVYLLISHELFSARVWKRLHPWTGALIVIVIAAPWHIAATLHNPPSFATTLHSGPGQYHGFLWFFFVNEQLLRFLNARYPRDYNTVPRLYFWLLNLVWLFPWSVYLPAASKLSYKPSSRAGRTRLLALCWAGVVLVFFTFSTTQEYYSMPCYPALALLLGSAMVGGGDWVRRGTLVLSGVLACALLAVLILLLTVRNVPTPGDISSALTSHPSVYSLSLGHMEDLTIRSFAYLRVPLIVAAIAFLIGLVAAVRARSGQRVFLALALMMVLFFHAARLALVVFDPYMSSRPLAEALLRSPQGKLLIDGDYYTFSSVFFYTNRTALIVNGRNKNLEYGSYAPGAANVFVDDSQFAVLWLTPERYYLVAERSAVPRLQRLVGSASLNVIAVSDGRLVLTNHPVPLST